MSYVAKVTSKGQLTLPLNLRRMLGLSKDSYVIIDEIGDYILMKKLKAEMDEITDIFEREVKKKRITRDELIHSLKKVQSKKWQ